MSTRSIQVSKHYMYYAIPCGENDELEDFVLFADSRDELLHKASQMYAFDDCNPVFIKVIISDHESLAYCGWRPGMEFTFRNIVTGEEVWTRYYEKWDH